MTSSPAYAFGTTVNLAQDDAIAAITAALKEEGFGILTQIDVAATLQQKLDVSFEPYVILGACNPHLAHQSLTTVHDIGLLLPCNVIVHAHNTQTRIDVADPIAMLGIIPHPQLTAIATEARERLRRAVQTLGTVDSSPTHTEGVTMYGADTCKDTIRSRAHLDALGVAYRYIDIDTDSAAEALVRSWLDGERRTPVITLPGSADRLVEPDDTTLDRVLDLQRLLPQSPAGDGSSSIS